MSRSFFIVFLLICLGFFLPLLINPEFLTNRDNDLGRTYIPLFNFFKESFFTYRQIPLWRGEQLMGESLVGNPVSSLFYPTNIIFLGFNVTNAAVLYLLIHLLMAGVFTSHLARSFKLSQLSSFAAACFYAFSIKILLHISAGHITMVAAFSYFPLTFLSVRKILAKTDFFWIVAGGFSLAFMYITYPSIFYYAVIFLVVYLLYEFFQTRAKSKFLKVLTLKEKFFPLFFLFVTAFGLMALAILPQLEFVSLSTRSQLKLEDVALPLWNFKRFIQSLIFPYANFANFDHESFLYLGAIPSLFAIIGFTKLSTSKKILLVIIGLLTLLFVAGLSTPVFGLAYKYLPFLKYSRITTRLWFIVSLIVALLATYALEKIKSKGLIYLVLVIFLAESFYIGYKKITAIPYLSESNDQLYRFLASDQDLFRVYCTTYCFNPKLLSKYKIEVLAGESPIQDAKFVEFLESTGNYQQEQFAVIFPPYQVWQRENPPVPNNFLLGQANVKYVVSTYPLTGENFNFINKFDDIYLYKNDDYRPRVYFENSNDRVEVKAITPNSPTFKFQSASTPRVLLLSEKYYPGWFAYFDNQKFNVELKQPIFRKITVPANSEQVELKYQPESFQLGKTLTLSTILFLVMYFIHIRKRR